ncbi:hypothetical protein AX16_009304 [Volvariella volvacea WC 439]|nr:hypothetical protein AX16_009304 [Volvariella volvacea WC 439]
MFTFRPTFLISSLATILFFVLSTPFTSSGSPSSALVLAAPIAQPRTLLGRVYHTREEESSSGAELALALDKAVSSPAYVHVHRRIAQPEADAEPFEVKKRADRFRARMARSIFAYDTIDRRAPVPEPEPQIKDHGDNSDAPLTKVLPPPPSSTDSALPTGTTSSSSSAAAEALAAAEN